MTMKRTAAILTTMIALCLLVPAYGLYMVSAEGAWPAAWPRELEKLRKQSRTLVGPMLDQSHHVIPFTKREEFEAAWPYLLKVKSKGAPIILVVHHPETDFFGVKPAGVLIHSPPAPPAGKPATPEAPIEGVTSVRERWMNTTFIELTVDGTIVDLNRIPFPADTPIIDERFNDAKSTPPGQIP
jgi:hypothetical protein